MMQSVKSAAKYFYFTNARFYFGNRAAFAWKKSDRTMR